MEAVVAKRPVTSQLIGRIEYACVEITAQYKRQLAIAGQCSHLLECVTHLQKVDQ